MQIKVRRSDRKSIEIVVRRDASVEVRAPLTLSDREIEQYVAAHKKWISRHVAEMNTRHKEESVRLQVSPKKLEQLREEAARIIPERVAYYAQRMGVSYGRITIRHQKTRWGSCSQKGNLNFNCMLLDMPPEILDYVVVHELAHRREMNHSAAFWRIVESVLPDYRERRVWLRNNGYKYIE